jgi:hypothetical protein
MKTISNRLVSVFVVLIMCMSGIHAQNNGANYYTVSGVIKDAQTKQPIAFATVFIPGANMGTVSNLNGVFSLKVLKSLNATEFGVSHLGYHTTLFPITENNGQGQEFLIAAHSVTLEEVIVQAVDPRQLMKQALGNASTRYPDEAHSLTGFYRETIKQRRDYLSISEAIVDVYQSPYTIYSRQQPDRTRIIQGRKSGDVKKADTLLLKLQGGPYVSMLLDVVKNQDIVVSESTLDFYEYELLDVVKIEDKLNYVIGFKPKVILPFPLYVGRFYVSVDDIAITMADFSLDLTDKDKAVNNFVVKKPARLRFNPLSTRYLVTYQKIDGRYHLSYVRTEVEFQADWRRRLFRTSYSIMSEMAITERKSGNVERFSYRESFRPTAVLADMVPVYFDDAFWGDYNVIQPDESLESAIEKFNKRYQNQSGENLDQKSTNSQGK